METRLYQNIDNSVDDGIFGAKTIVIENYVLVCGIPDTKL